MNTNTSLFINPCRTSMQKTLELFKQDLNKINVNEINISELQKLKIIQKNNTYSLINIAQLDIKYISLIHIIPYDKKFLIPIEKIIRSNLQSINISTNDDKIIIKLAYLSTEQRYEIVRNIKIKSEEKKIYIRNIRRTYNNQIKKYIKKLHKSIELEHQTIKVIQKITDEAIKNIDNEVKKKINLIKKI